MVEGPASKQSGSWSDFVAVALGLVVLVGVAGYFTGLGPLGGLKPEDDSQPTMFSNRTPTTLRVPTAYNTVPAPPPTYYQPPTYTLPPTTAYRPPTTSDYFQEYLEEQRLRDLERQIDCLNGPYPDIC